MLYGAQSQFIAFNYTNRPTFPHYCLYISLTLTFCPLAISLDFQNALGTLRRLVPCDLSDLLGLHTESMSALCSQAIKSFVPREEIKTVFCHG